MVRRFFLHVYMMRIALLILLLLGVVLPMAFRSPFLHALADLESNQILMVSLSSFLLVSAAITCAFLVLLYGSDRADGNRVPIPATLAPAALPERLPLSGWVVATLYITGALCYVRFLSTILQTMKLAHVHPDGLSGLFWYRAVEGAIGGLVTISVVFILELWLSNPREAPQIEVFVFPMVYLFRESAWLQGILRGLSNARPGGAMRGSKLILILKRVSLLWVWVLGPGYGRFNEQGKPIELNAGHGFAGILASVCGAVYLMAGAGGHQRLYTDAPFEAPRAYDAVLLQVILLLLLGCWLLSGLSFYFDRFRVLVLLPLVSVLAVTSRFGTSDHAFHTFARPDTAVTVPNAESRFVSAGEHVIAIAAAGGGIQAAAWTSQVLCGLRQELGVMFERNVLVISGVSGGSVGAMFYLRCLESPAASSEAATAATNSSLEAIAWGLVHPDLRHAILPLQGFWWPGDDRGWALERAIRKNAQFAPPDRLLTSRSAVEDWPVLLFNSTEVRTGDPMVFTNSDFPSAADTVPANHKLHSFHQVYGGRDVSLETAVRMSAAFPYVSPAARADVPWNAGHLADGGYFENSGMFSLTEWLKEGAIGTKDDRGRQDPRHPPRKILIMQIDAFPDSMWKGPADQPRRWAYQLIAPVLTVLHVRSEGALVRDATERSDLIELLTRRGYDAHAITARYVPSVGNNSATGVTCPVDPPLTWHMTDAEKICIRQNWIYIKEDLISRVREFLNSEVAPPASAMPGSVRSERLKDGLYLQEMVKH